MICSNGVMNVEVRVTDVVAWQPNEMRKEQRESMNLIDW